MLSFDAVGFAAFTAFLNTAEHVLVNSFEHPNEPLGTEDLEYVTEAIKGLVVSLQKIPVASTALRAQVSRIQAALEQGVNEATARHRLIVLLQEVNHNLQAELAAHKYLVLPESKVYLFEQTEPLFGFDVASRFSEAGRDIADAGRCLAFEQWTASVFHLMRVLEHGLRDLAERVGAEFPASIELENWKNIVDKIEKEIRAKESSPKSMQKSADLEFYSKAASQFWHFKEAWRNHVSHSRATYDEVEAFHVYDAVKHFMQQLATRPSPQQSNDSHSRGVD